MVLFLYAQTNHFFFVNIDDGMYVIQNSHVRAGLSWNTFAWAMTSTDANWHPVTWISHALDCQLFGINPAGHHFVSVLLHALNAVLLFLLLARATGRMGASFFVAALFAVLFVAVSFVSNWAKAQFGTSGIYTLAAIVGVTDIDPFVLNLAQGGTAGMSNSALTAAILIAASSNNVLKALYAAFFAGGRATAVSAAVLVLLAIAGAIIAVVIGGR